MTSPGMRSATTTPSPARGVEGPRVTAELVGGKPAPLFPKIDLKAGA